MTGSWTDPQKNAEELRRRERAGRNTPPEAAISTQLSEIRSRLDRAMEDTAVFHEEIAVVRTLINGLEKAGTALREAAGTLRRHDPERTMAEAEGRITGAVDNVAEGLRRCQSILDGLSTSTGEIVGQFTVLAQLRERIREMDEAFRTLDAENRERIEGQKASFQRTADNLGRTVKGATDSLDLRFNRVEKTLTEYGAGLSRARKRRRAFLWAFATASCLLVGLGSGVWLQRDHAPTAWFLAGDAVFHDLRTRYGVPILRCLDSARETGDQFHCYLTGPLPGDPPQRPPPN